MHDVSWFQSVYIHTYRQWRIVHVFILLVFFIINKSQIWNLKEIYYLNLNKRVFPYIYEEPAFHASKGDFTVFKVLIKKSCSINMRNYTILYRSPLVFRLALVIKYPERCTVQVRRVDARHLLIKAFVNQLAKGQFSLRKTSE
jgi:hypothetical protein